MFGDRAEYTAKGVTGDGASLEVTYQTVHVRATSSVVSLTEHARGQEGRQAVSMHAC